MFHLTLFLIIVSQKYFFTSSITCDDIVEKGSGSAFSIEDLSSLSSLGKENIEDCIILLGKEPLSDKQSGVIWSSLLQIYGSAEGIPEESLQHLGWVITGILPEHFYNLSLTEVDTVAALGKCSALNHEQLESLCMAVFEQWNSKQIEDLSSFDLMTLRQILCAFNASDILRIHPDAYRDASQELSTLTNCSKEIFEGLAQLATSPHAFGNPKYWTSLQIASIGCVVAGLPSIKQVPPSAMEGFTKNSVQCLPPNVLQEMSDEQLSNLSPSAAGALSEKQLSALYQSQKYAIESAIKGIHEIEKSSAESIHNNLLLLSLVIFSILYKSKHCSLKNICHVGSFLNKTC